MCAEILLVVLGALVLAALIRSSRRSGKPSQARSHGSEVKSVPTAELVEESSGPFTLRDGKSVPVSKAMKAWTSGDLAACLEALSDKPHPLDRHYLLLTIVELSYRKRDSPEMFERCLEIGRIHMAELPALIPAIKSNNGRSLPSIPTPKYLAIALGEVGRFDEAVAICEQAIALGIGDGTSSGFEGRIARLKKKQLAARAEQP